jgi:hypothetical protein
MAVLRARALVRERLLARVEKLRDDRPRCRFADLDCRILSGGDRVGPGAALLVTVVAVITIVAAFNSACLPSTRCASTARLRRVNTGDLGRVEVNSREQSLDALRRIISAILSIVFSCARRPEM